MDRHVSFTANDGSTFEIDVTFKLCEIIREHFNLLSVDEVQPYHVREFLRKALDSALKNVENGIVTLST
jgi:hypothetical protein